MAYLNIIIDFLLAFDFDELIFNFDENLLITIRQWKGQER